MKREPVAVAGALVILANSVIALLVLLGAWDVTKEALAQTNLIGVNFVAFVGAWVGRSSVQPLKTPLVLGTTGSHPGVAQEHLGDA